MATTSNGRAPLVVAGASAGGVEALTLLTGSLPPDFGAAVLVVLHIASAGTSVLPRILARTCALPVSAAVEGQRIEAGNVYIAPADHHLLVGDGVLHLVQGPKENGHRPAIDPTMRSAARAYGAEVTGVVLSGTRDDGTGGLAAIKAAGGLAVVQDPEEALYDAMPRSAMRDVDVDAVLPVRDMAAWLVDPHERAPLPASANGSAAGNGVFGTREPPAIPASAEGTRVTCPDCGGVLFKDEENGVKRYRCSVGHSYSPDSLLVEHDHRLESALWTAVRGLEDRGALLDDMAERARERGRGHSAASFEDQARDVREKAEIIRVTLSFPGPTGT